MKNMVNIFNMILKMNLVVMGKFTKELTGTFPSGDKIRVDRDGNGKVEFMVMIL